MRRLAAGALLALLSAGTARADIRDLAADLQSACRPAPNGVAADVPGRYGVIGAKEVRDALFKHYPVSVAAVDLAGDSKTAAERLAERALAASARSPGDDHSLYRIGRAVTGWTVHSGGTASPVLRLEDGGLRIVTTGDLEPEVVLTRIFEGQDNGLQIICNNPRTEPEAGAKKQSPTREAFVLAKKADDLNGAKFEEQSFAEFSYSDDRQTHAQSWAVELAAGWRWRERSEGNLEADLKWTPSVYVAYARKGENDPATDGYVNNLDFGAQVDGRFGVVVGGNTWTSYYGFSGVYETDDDFRSAAYRAEVVIDPPLPDSLPFHRAYRALVRNPTVLAADFKWGVDLVADWSHVDDPGRKAALVDGAEYVRLGYDAGFRLHFGPAKRLWSLVWAVDYKVRDGQTHDGGDAQLFTSSLNYLDKPNTNWSFGVSYDRGEDLQSFESSELWKVVLGLRF